MAKTQGAPAPRLTRFYPFYQVSAGENYLFSVNPDVRTVDAFEQLVCFLGCATEMVRDLAVELAENEAEQQTAWAALYLCEISYAIANAAICAAHREERGHD